MWRGRQRRAGLVAGIVVGLVGFGIGWAVWNRSPSQVPWEAPTPGGLIEKTRDVLARACGMTVTLAPEGDQIVLTAR